MTSVLIERYYELPALLQILAGAVVWTWPLAGAASGLALVRGNVTAAPDAATMAVLAVLAVGGWCTFLSIAGFFLFRKILRHL